MITLIGFDPAVHFGRFFNLAFADFKTGVDSADIFAAHQSDAGNGGAGGKMFPVFTGNLSRTKRPGKYGQAHLYFLFPAVFRFRVDGGKYRRIGACFDALGQTFGAYRIPLIAQMRIIQGVILVGARRHFTKADRVEHLPSPER